MCARFAGVLAVGVLALLAPPRGAGAVKVAFLGDSGIGNDDPGDSWTDYLGVTHAPVYLVDGQPCLNYAGEPCRLKSSANRVFAQAKAQGADLLVHAGDLDYESAPVAWGRFLDQHLQGMDFLGVMGNHDQDGWDGVEYLWSGTDGYREVMQARQPARASCTGTYGEDFACEYGDDVLLVMSSIGVRESGEGANRDKAAFVREQLEASSAPWKVCLWHMTMEAMQVSYKGDATGWEVYEICREHGAFIVVSHAHIYSRSYEMGRFADERWGNHKKNLVVSSWDPSTINLANGTTGVVVVGTGGFKNERQLLSADHWATVFSTECMVEQLTCKRARFPDIFGTLVCDFRATQSTAECTFVTAEQGKVIDRFTLTRNPADAVSNEGMQLLAPEQQAVTQPLSPTKASDKSAAPLPLAESALASPLADLAAGPAKDASTVSTLQRDPSAVSGAVEAAACTDTPPPPGDSACAEQLSWDKCGRDWMIANKYCDMTCGRCAQIPARAPAPMSAAEPRKR